MKIFKATTYFILTITLLTSAGGDLFEATQPFIILLDQLML
jgi:hypothetical protein